MKIFFGVVFCLIIGEVNSQNFNLSKPIVELEKDYIKYYQNENDINSIAESLVQLFQTGKAKDYTFPNLSKEIEKMNVGPGLSIIKSSDKLLTVYSFYTGGSMSSSVDVLVYRTGKNIITSTRNLNDEGGAT